jgi:hypothetical protein
MAWTKVAPQAVGEAGSLGLDGRPQLPSGSAHYPARMLRSAEVMHTTVGDIDVAYNTLGEASDPPWC